MTDRKKPGVAFWATVGLAIVLAYPLSVGPIQWAENRSYLSLDPDGPLSRFYYPLEWLHGCGPEPLRSVYQSYCRLWEKRR